MGKISVKGIPISDGRYSLLQNIVNQLESCHYTCEVGALEDNQAFIELKEQAKMLMEEPKFVLVFAKYPNVGFLKNGLFDSMRKGWDLFPTWTKIVIKYHTNRISRSVNFLDKFEKEIKLKQKNT